MAICVHEWRVSGPWRVCVRCQALQGNQPLPTGWTGACAVCGAPCDSDNDFCIDCERQ